MCIGTSFCPKFVIFYSLKYKIFLNEICTLPLKCLYVCLFNFSFFQKPETLVFIRIHSSCYSTLTLLGWFRAKPPKRKRISLFYSIPPRALPPPQARSRSSAPPPPARVAATASLFFLVAYLLCCLHQNSGEEPRPQSFGFRGARLFPSSNYSNPTAPREFLGSAPSLWRCSLVRN
jgi:hypothetical protein